jgi:regulator of replication initiation timing
VERKPVKNTNLKTRTVANLEQKIRRLQIQINGFKNKILKLENKTLKQEQKNLKLQAENTKLKEVRPIVSFNIAGLHDKPPKT